MSIQKTALATRRAEPAMDGDGVTISRVIGMNDTGMDPFLLIDELRGQFSAELGGGFPSHPHRGMQTLTYVRTGGIVHEDSRGNRGEVNGGGVQWMSAGRGIIHSEMPPETDSGEFHAFQIWINLAAKDKMGEPRYRDLTQAELTLMASSAYSCTAIAGTWKLGENSITGPLSEISDEAGLADFTVAPDARITIDTTDSDHFSAWLPYVYEGSILIDDHRLEKGQLTYTTPGDHCDITAGTNGASFPVLKGKPLKEPVVAHGPFVMNSVREIEQAIRDYNAGTFAA